MPGLPNLSPAGQAGGPPWSDDPFGPTHLQRSGPGRRRINAGIPPPTRLQVAASMEKASVKLAGDDVDGDLTWVESLIVSPVVENTLACSRALSTLRVKRPKLVRMEWNWV